MCKRIPIICFALRRVSAVSDTIRSVALPPDDSNTYEGESAVVCGFGQKSRGKCVDPFNLYSTDKE